VLDLYMCGGGQDLRWCKDFYRCVELVGEFLEELFVEFDTGEVVSKEEWGTVSSPEAAPLPPAPDSKLGEGRW